MLTKVMALLKEEEGQGMTEYGLVLGIIAVAAVATLVLFRDQIVLMYQEALALVNSR
ncbi:MAG TPA: Flp family type IVb pilin [Bacilli bacterium]